MIKLYGGRGEGASVTPSFVAAGAGVNAFNDLDLEYPSVAAGMVFFAQVYSQLGESSGAPDGWVLVHEFTDGAVTQYVYRRTARSTGSDSGTVTFSMTLGDPNQGRIYAFEDVALADFIESIDDTYTTNGSADGPTVAPNGPARLAVAFVSSNNGVTGMAAFTGESGGDWTEAVAEQTSGNGPGIQLQTAPLAAGGTISGGTAAVDGVRAIVIGFALAGT